MTSRESAPRLGRGLAALLGEARAEAELEEAADARSLALDALEPGPFQPREATPPASLEDLVASIRSRGVLQPLLVRPHPAVTGRYQIIAGERRWRAARQAGLPDVPVLIRPLTDAEAMAAGLVENLQRQDLNPIEEAHGYRRLMDEFAMTQDALGAAVGKSRSHVANTLRLLNLPAGVQREVRNGALSAGHARALLAHPDPVKAALQVIARGLSVRQTEELASRRTEAASGTGSGKPAADPDITALERRLTERLGLQAEITAHGERGTLRISYRTLDQLEGLLALLLPD